MGRTLGKLGFDIDGVLYPWHEIVLEDLILLGAMPKGSTVGSMFTFPGAFHKFSQNMQQGILGSSKYYVCPVFREGARDVLHTLSENWEIFYVTSRPFEIESPTKAWVRGMGFPYRDNVYVVNGGKRAIVELLDLDIFIDDRTSHVDELHDICPVILVTRPWNEEYNEDNHVRVNELHELVPLLEGGLDANRYGEKRKTIG